MPIIVPLNMYINIKYIQYGIIINKNNFLKWSKKNGQKQIARLLGLFSYFLLNHIHL